MKPILPLVFASVLVLSACSSTDVSDDMPPVDDTTMEDTDDVMVPVDDDTVTDDGSSDDSTVEARVIEMTVDDWTFTPAA